MPIPDITYDYIKQIEAGKVSPSAMADVLYAMHAAMVDRFESVSIWLPTDLEHVADDVLKAVEIDEQQPEEKTYRQCAEEGAIQRFAARGEA
jgi:hypothetical protein